MSQEQVNEINSLDASALARRRALLTRVLNSPQFIRSSRQRELLTFICDRALSSDTPDLSEAEIGHHVFGRREDYNPGDDNIVRVTVRQLRGKLADFFATDGLTEPVVIEIPKGAYVPVFRPRSSVSPSEPGNPVEARGRTRRDSMFLTAAIAGSAALLLGVLACWLLIQNRAFRTENAALRSPPNPLSELLFGAQNRVNIVVTDAGSQAVQYFAGHVVSLDEYAARQLPPLPDQSRAAQFMKSFARIPNTGLADTVIAATIAESAGRHRDSIRVRHARNVTARDFYAENFVLIGGTRANPWTRMFEDSLNFAFSLDPASGAASIANRKPSPGELPLYPPTRPFRCGYGRVAVVPNLSQSGKVVLIAGTDMASTEGAGAFMLDPSSLEILHSALHTTNLDALKSFELLLETATVEGTPLKARLLAFRLQKPLEK
jgi:hypothetical protein